jgi:hypothetical protein
LSGSGFLASNLALFLIGGGFAAWAGRLLANLRGHLPDDRLRAPLSAERFRAAGAEAHCARAALLGRFRAAPQLHRKLA